MSEVQVQMIVQAIEHQTSVFISSVILIMGALAFLWLFVIVKK